MKKYYITMSFEAKGYWRDSIHQTVKAIDENEAVKLLADEHYLQLTNKGRPTANMFIDDKDGHATIAGYIYRIKDEIDGKRVFFDAWTTIHEMTPINYKEIN